jgi:hypothetical protein
MNGVKCLVDLCRFISFLSRRRQCIISNQYCMLLSYNNNVNRREENKNTNKTRGTSVQQHQQ